MAHFTNAQLAQSISDMIATDLTMKEEFVNWIAGVVDGGVGNDGKFPLTDYLGNTVVVSCPAQLADDVSSEVTGAAGHATDAETAQTAAELAKTQAETAKASAETAQASSEAARDTAVTAKNDAESARTVAIAQAAAAAADAVLTAADVVLTAADVVSTDADATAAALSEAKAEDWAVEVEDTPVETGPDQFSALHWAAKASAFDPDLFYLRTVLDTTFSNYTLTSGLSIANWNTAYGWGDHGAVGYITAAPTHTGHVTGDTGLVLVVAAITGQSELTSGLDGADELIVNDGGIIKRMDITVIEAYMEANIALPIGQVSGFTDNSTNWDTAHGWGDHGVAGYLTAVVASDVNSESSTIGQVLTSDGASAATWQDGGGGGGGLAWEQVTSADTIAAGEGFAVKNTGSAFDITIEATIAADDEFVVHNSSQSTGAVSIQPNSGHTIKGSLANIVGGTDTIIIGPGETIHLIAISSSVLEII